MASFRTKRGEDWKTPPEDRPLALARLAERWAETWGGLARFEPPADLGTGEALSLPLLELARSALVLLGEKLTDPASGVSWAEPEIVVYPDPGEGWARELVLEEGLTPERLQRAATDERLAFVLLSLTRRAAYRLADSGEVELLVPPHVRANLETLSQYARNARKAWLLSPLEVGGFSTRVDAGAPPNVWLADEPARLLVVPGEPGLTFEGDAAGRAVWGTLAIRVYPLEVKEDGRSRYPVAVGIMLEPKLVVGPHPHNEDIGEITFEAQDLASWTEAERSALLEGVLAWLDETLARYTPSATAEPTPDTLRASSGLARDLVLHDGATRLDLASFHRLNALSGLSLPQSLAKVPRWEDLCREEVERILADHGEAAFRSERNIRGALLEKKTDKKTREPVAVLTREAEEGLLAAKGSRAFIRTKDDRDGKRREYLTKQFRSGGGFAELGLSWYGQAAPFAADEVGRELERERNRNAVGELFKEKREANERMLRQVGAIRDAHELAVILLYRFGDVGQNPVRLTVDELKVGLACEKDPNGLDRVLGAIRALQELRFVFNASAVGGGIEASGPFLNDFAHHRKGPGGHGEGFVLARISEGFVGVLHVFNTADARIRDARAVLRYDWRKKLEDENREELSSGFLRGFQSLAPYFDKTAGFTDSQKRLRAWIEDQITLRKDQATRGRESEQSKKTAPDAYEPRVYRTDFCPLLPEGKLFHGALGHFQRTRHGEPEKGRTLGGTKRHPSRSGKSGGRSGGLLEIMGYTLPPGAASRARRKVYEDALQDIRCVVVEELKGVAAGRTPDGRWLTLADAVEKLSERELREGVSWCLFLPDDWQNQRRDLYEQRQASRFERGETPYRVTVSTGAPPESAASALWKRLAPTRNDRKLSQSEVGRLFGVSQQIVACWEAGPEPGEDGKVRGKPVPAYLESLLRRWIETGETPSPDELAAARGASLQPPAHQ